ncbi:polysaccharide biosynthesis tyrosine autokinase [Pleurocapsales cyanobacterium LEGE 06147]|nr:polysaccharide biosynthesis tyrosine autokinase [Pleurocapsales cyanobacterium LEGE 06147]
MSNTLIRPEIIHLPVQETGFSISDLKQTLYRRWKPALAAAAIAFTGIFIPAAIQTPKYQSETLILLNNSKNQQAAPVVPGLNVSYSPQDLSTEIFILRSYPLVAKAVDQVRQEFSDLSISNVVQNLSIRQAEIGDSSTNVVIVSYIDSDPARGKAVLEALNSVYINYSLERQRSQASNAIRFINEQLPEAQQELDKSALAIRQFRQRYNVVDPNTYAEQVAQFRQSLEQQTKEVEIAIGRTQSQYQQLQNQLAELGQDPQTSVAYTVLGQDQVYQNLARQLKDLEARHSLGRVDFYDNYPVIENMKLKSEELRRLLQERAQQVLGNAASQVVIDRVLVSQVSVSQSTGTEGSGTEVSAAGSTLQTLANSMLQVQNELTGLQSQLEGIALAKGQIEVYFQRIPQLQQVYAELQRQFEVKSQAVNYLLQRLQELQIAEAEQSAPWQVLEAPRLSTNPISPNLQRSLILALIAGGLAGVAAALLLEQLDQRVKQVEEVKQLTQLSLLGNIPKVEQPLVEVNTDSREGSHTYQYSSFTEGVRALAMNLRYLMIETGRIKSLALTSATSAEGKTTVTYNLGLVLAELGLRVLIVDADMRKPKIHKLAKLCNENGLSNAIATDRPWSDFVQTSAIDNLHLITAGSTSPNPIALLNSEKMRQLVQQWREAYDYVLVDTPPIGVMADAKTLANLVDTMVFVTGIGRTNRRAIANSLDILRDSQCNIAGFVANLVDRDFDYYAYSYYDSYYNQHSSNGNGNGHGHESQGRLQQLVQQFRRR